MKNLFTVIVKLFGVYLLCGAVLTLSTLVQMRYPEDQPFDYGVLVYPATSLVLAFVLLIGAKRLAQLLGVSDLPVGLEMTEQTALRFGILLLGLFLMLSNLTHILGYMLSPMEAFEGWTAVSRRLLFIFANLVPLYLIFGARRIAAALWRPSQLNTKEE